MYMYLFGAVGNVWGTRLSSEEARLLYVVVLPDGQCAGEGSLLACFEREQL